MRISLVVFVVCVAVIGIVGNGYLLILFGLGSVLIVRFCYTVLFSQVSPHQTVIRRARTRKRYTAKRIRMKDCVTCGGAGSMRLVGGKLVKIPRSEWEHAAYRYANLQTCRTCNGLGLVADL